MKARCGSPAKILPHDSESHCRTHVSISWAPARRRSIAGRRRSRRRGHRQRTRCAALFAVRRRRRRAAAYRAGHPEQGSGSNGDGQAGDRNDMKQPALWRCEPGNHLWVANDAGHFADAVAGRAQGAGQRSRSPSAGAAMSKQHHNWRRPDGGFRPAAGCLAANRPCRGPSQCPAHLGRPCQLEPVRDDQSDHGRRQYQDAPRPGATIGLPWQPLLLLIAARVPRRPVMPRCRCGSSRPPIRTVS